ncbi:agamous-like MADS-box protein AGL62 [Macadamia integrifolia]|uniref:agamous-like MADS-box protein AGL62 n=1 Tax=Macadamia integrifolia TaxID=60698 RepID=UPI001C4F68C9|nr:agamous-like MADS-box protein AGL62 [Macadamia integrifolia]
MVTGRTSMGRQRIEMRRIARYSSRHVTFSKRRSGLFKKASELCTLTGAEVGIVVFSPSGNAFSFGHPSVDYVVHRFLSENFPQMSEGSVFSLVDGYCRANVEELTWEYSELLVQLDEEKKKSEELDRVRDNLESTPWWEAPIDNLNLSELQCLTDALAELKIRLTEQATQMVAQVPNPSPLLAGSSVGAADLPSTSQTTMNDDALTGPPACGFKFWNGVRPEPF